MALLLCAMMAQSTHSQVIGTVTSERKEPIRSVAIWGNQTKGIEAETDSERFFKLPDNPGEILHFLKHGFRPKTVILRPDDTRLKIVLLREASPIWRIRSCKTSEGRKLSLPFLPKFFIVSAEAKMEKFSDVDYGKTSITFPNDSRPLEIWWGMIGKPEDREQLLISGSSEVQERWVHVSNGAIGTDARGQTLGGMFWRYSQFPGGFAIYQDVSPDVARF